MSSNTPSGAVSGVAYQSIIIALIAGGILTIGVVSILWRRRSQRTWAAMRADGHQHGMVPFGLGMGMGFGLGIEDETAAGRGRGRRKKLGRMPQVWDALIGPREVDDEAGEKGEVAGGERGVAVQWGKGELTGDVLQADAGEGWHPVSIALHEHTQTPPSPIPDHAKLPPPPVAPPAYTAEMTVLIAMPSPDRPIPFHPLPLHSSDTSSTTYSYSAHHTYIHPPLPPHVDAEDESLPELTIATTSVPVSSASPSEVQELGGWVVQAEEARLAGFGGSSRRAGEVPGSGSGRRGTGNAPLIHSAGYRGTGQDEQENEHEREAEPVGWAGRLGIPGVIRRGDMIARPRTPEREREREWGGRARRSERHPAGLAADPAQSASAHSGHDGGRDLEANHDDPRSRPNLFRLASMSHSMGVFRFGSLAGLPPAGRERDGGRGA